MLMSWLCTPLKNHYLLYCEHCNVHCGSTKTCGFFTSFFCQKFVQRSDLDRLGSGSAVTLPKWGAAMDAIDCVGEEAIPTPEKTSETSGLNIDVINRATVNRYFLLPNYLILSTQTAYLAWRSAAAVV